jgi:hypothetical protein
MFGLCFGIADETGTIWKSMTNRKIASILGCEPSMNELISKAGLVETFEAEWIPVVVPAVKEFVLGFDSSTMEIEFRGARLDWSREHIEEAFNLPVQEDPQLWRAKWSDNRFFDMFTVKRSNTNPSSVEKLKPEFGMMQKPIRLIHEALLGKSRPTCTNGKQMWVYWSLWWHQIPKEDRRTMECPGLEPDFTRLVMEDLTAEILALKAHLSKGEPPKKRYAANCGSAITKYLLFLGYNLEELKLEVDQDDAEEVEAIEKQGEESEEEQDADTIAAAEALGSLDGKICEDQTIILLTRVKKLQSVIKEQKLDIEDQKVKIDALQLDVTYWKERARVNYNEDIYGKSPGECYCIFCASLSRMVVNVKTKCFRFMVHGSRS